MPQIPSTVCNKKIIPMASWLEAIVSFKIIPFYAFVKLPRLLKTGNDERISIFYEKVSRKDEVVVTWRKQ